MTEVTTRTLTAPTALLAYDVRGNGSDSVPPLLLIGSPMGAAGFTTLAGHFPDRTVVTYDPRGADRSRRTDTAAESTPEEHADDLRRIIAALERGPVEVFASSGGAVNALALVAAHPELVRTLVAHEPPIGTVLPDRDHVLAACADIRDTYRQAGFGPAMAKFLVLVGHRGELTPDYAAGPAPDPATYGLPAEDDGSRSDPLVGQNIVACTHYEPDLEALRAASTRVVLAAGVGSEGEMGHRAAVALADRLGSEVVRFPGDHGGFMGGEYGMRGEPDAFADTLRRVLADRT